MKYGLSAQHRSLLSAELGAFFNSSFYFWRQPPTWSLLLWERQVLCKISALHFPTFVSAARALPEPQTNTQVLWDIEL